MMNRRLNQNWNWLPFGLCFLLISNSANPPAFSQVLPTSISLTVVEGEGAVNQTRQRVTKDPVVRVEDENGKPVTGAAVAFTLPVSGSTGEFSNGSKNLTIVTDADGTASATRIKCNEFPGKLQIHVNASYKGLTARTLITQINEGPEVSKSSGGGSGKLIAILAIVGAAAAGGAVVATHKGSSPSTTPGTPTPTAPTPIGINPGTTIIGPPR
jgi:hypothetical protein